MNQQGNVTTKIVKVKDVLILKNKAFSYFTSKRWVYSGIAKNLNLEQPKDRETTG